MARSTQITVSKSEVAKAQAQLTRMRRSLAAWLKYRQMNDEVLAGTRRTTKPLGYAQQIILQHRDVASDRRLADQLHTLLSEVMPEARLPEPTDDHAAVALAQIAITGQAPLARPTPQGASPTWLWPVVIVGGLLLAVTTAISSYADVAKSKEEYACIQAGACTDYGFWLKVGGIAMLGWFLWTQTSLKETVRSLGKPRSHTRGG